MSKPVSDGERLAAALRALRRESGLSSTELASRLGCSQPKVSKMELGRTLPDPADVDAWARITGAEPALHDELLAIAERMGYRATEVRRELAPGRRRAQQYVQRLEAAASVVRVFSIDVVIGLAQTVAYADAIFRLGRKVGPPDEPREEAVRARLARQTVLDDQDKQFYLLMSEYALHRRLVAASQMREQLKRLSALSRRANVVAGVIPFNAPEVVHQYQSFAILGDPLVDDEATVVAETLTRRITIRSAGEIAEYIAHFEALWSAAVEGEELRELLRGLMAGLGAE